MQAHPHVIKSIRPGSAAEGAGIRPGELLLTVNGEEIRDVFDYQYLTTDTRIELQLSSGKKRPRTVVITKELDEDPGLVFEEGLMDEYRSCHNKCIFCFIDQMPKGMRETLYFKDDDSRLSFLQGNYVTLTNMSDDDIDRIIRYHLSPINISFQTTDPELRCRMMGNRFAGKALEKAERLHEAGIEMNGQIVLCKGINDGEALEKSIRDLSAYIPELQSLSVVPVGLTAYRQGLYPLEPFNAEDARRLIGQIEEWQKKMWKKHRTHFVHASDEWYVLAGLPLPSQESYDGYLQLENGVGMLRLLLTEFEAALDGLHKSDSRREFSLVTGYLVYPTIEKMTEKMKEFYPEVTVHCCPVRNDFFGHNITVTGLLTGKDIVTQLRGKELGDTLYLPENLLRAGEEVLLDDMTVGEISEALGIPVRIVKTDGASFTEMYRSRNLYNRETIM